MDLDRRQLRDAEAPRSSEAVLSQQVSEIKVELEQYKAELASLRQQMVSPYQDDRGEAGAVTSRRRMLKHMVAGVAGVGALSLATVVGSSPIVQAETTGENAIDASGGTSGYGGKFTSSFAQIQLVPASTAVPTSFSNHNTGEFFVDQKGALFYSVNSTGSAGTPDRWVKLAGPTTAGTLHLLPTPSRFLDTRQSPYGVNDVNHPFVHSESRAYKLSRGTGKLTSNAGVVLDDGATGVLGNITVVSQGSAGFAQVSPNGVTLNDPSTINFNANTATANSFSVALNSSGQFTILIYLYAPAVTGTHVIVDITGYYY